MMVKKVWQKFLEVLWPLIWPIIRDAIVRVLTDLIEWIQQQISVFLRKHGQEREAQARTRADDATTKAATSSDREERQKFEAEAKAWRTVAEDLQADNDRLSAEIRKILRRAESHAKERAKDIRLQGETKKQILLLPAPPSEAIEQSVPSNLSED